jgi:hypothetical protein
MRRIRAAVVEDSTTIIWRAWGGGSESSESSDGSESSESSEGSADADMGPGSEDDGINRHEFVRQTWLPASGRDGRHGGLVGWIAKCISVVSSRGGDG